MRLKVKNKQSSPAALIAAIKSQYDKSENLAIDFDELRAAIPALAEATDGAIHKACNDAGYDVETE